MLLTEEISDEKTQTSVSQRLNLIVDEFEKGVKAGFARSISMTPQGAGDLLSGKKGGPSFQVLQNILMAYPTVNPEWLISGTGEMLRETNSKANPLLEEAIDLHHNYMLLKDLGLRLAEIRRLRGLTKSEVASYINQPLKLITDIEEGEFTPDYEQLFALSELYKVGYGYLRQGIDENMYFLKRTLELESRDKSHTNNDLKLITVDSDNQENIVLVSTQAAASYPTRHLEPEYYTELPAFSIPLPQLTQGSYRAFQVSGAAMVPAFYPEDWVIALHQPADLANIKLDSPYVIVTKEAVLIKRVTALRNDGRISLASDNDEYLSYHLRMQDILELWQVKASINFQFPSRSVELAKKVSVLENVVRRFVQQMNPEQIAQFNMSRVDMTNEFDIDSEVFFTLHPPGTDAPEEGPAQEATKRQRKSK